MKKQLERIPLVFIIAALVLMLALELASATVPPSSQGNDDFTPDVAAKAEQQFTILVDDFIAQPKQGEVHWWHNRLGGEKWPLGIPENVVWGSGTVTASVLGAETVSGIWMSFNHPNHDLTPLNFAAIFPPQIKTEYQGHITGLQVQVLDGQGTFLIELRAADPTLPGQEIVLWRNSAGLAGGVQTFDYTLPQTLTEVLNINLKVIGGDGDFVVIDQVELIATVPQLALEERAFLWSYAMLLNNWDPQSGLTRDNAYMARNEFDNISASGLQVAAAVLAEQLGFISHPAAVEIATKTTEALLALPTCHGLWPHVTTKVMSGTEVLTPAVIVSGTEWSSIDTVVADIALIEALQALGLPTTAVEQHLKSIDWVSLITGTASTQYIAHGYTTDCDRLWGQPYTAVWKDFGLESWLVNLGYAVATGQVADFDHAPPTANGSGFIDELAWLLMPASCGDRWGTDWCAYSQQALERQLTYYDCAAATANGCCGDNYTCGAANSAADCSCCYAHPYYQTQQLFGLSADEAPNYAVFPAEATVTYLPFGTCGSHTCIDGTDPATVSAGISGTAMVTVGHAVIVPHYAAVVSALRPTQASSVWQWLESRGLFTPLNNVASLMCRDDTTCDEVLWSDRIGSWEVGLQTLGWGRLLVADQHPLYQGFSANAVLSRGYRVLSPYTVTLLLDDFLAPPRWGETLYPFNRFNGIRSALGDVALTWSLGKMTVTATSATWGSGMWTSFGYPYDEKRAVNFSAILPSPIISTYQGTITSLTFRIADATPGRSLKLELKNEQPDALGNINYAPIWSASAVLTASAQTVSWYIPPLTNVTNLNWFLEAPDAGDYIVIDDIALTAAIPATDLATTGFVWSYAMLLNNWNPLSGLTRDTAQKASDEFDSISASGAQAAAAAVAWDLGVIPYTTAVEIVSQTTSGLLALPRACHGLWPHFVQNGQIVSGTEWSSIDTAIAAIALLEARQALSLDTSAVEAFLKSIDWPALVLANGSLSHGCWTDGSPIEPTGQGGWRDFGTESWLVNYAYAVADGEVAVFDDLPPTYNGSGFIDELAWLFVPAPTMDRFGIRWDDYRAWAATCQVDYYNTELTPECLYHYSHPFYSAQSLFGLSAAEDPLGETYQAFGVGGVISPNQGIDLLGHAVIVPHDAALAAVLTPTAALSTWSWLESNNYFTPLSNPESLMCIDEPACETIVWNAQQSSWNLSLQTLGWGRYLTGEGATNPLHNAMQSNATLAAGYRVMSPWITMTDYPVFSYPGHPVTVTVAWGNIPTDGQYKLRVQFENKFTEPHLYYFTDITAFATTENRAITFAIPADAPAPRVASRFVAAFISTSSEWEDTLVADFGYRDVTLESISPQGWTMGHFAAPDQDAGAFLDPEGQPFYVKGMTYDYAQPATITSAILISQLAQIQALGFNAINLYPRSGFNSEGGLESDFLPEVLSWADHHRMAVYIRVWYQDVSVYPDFMAAQYRQQAKASLAAALHLIQPHPSVLAVDLDQRWLLDVDWWGERRYGVPYLGQASLDYLPTWLAARFTTIDALNTAWGKTYTTFADVLNDTTIISAGQVLDLDRSAWRLDIIAYTLWTMDDFMADILSYARSIAPQPLYTYTNDRAEVIPFPLSTRASSGIDFASVAHYNFVDDFYRDWGAQAKLTYETLWQRNLYNLPVFMRESGWRTTTLSQTPPLTDYAWSLNERHKAELYLRQATLLALYPWVPGWAYFKWDDKPVEGDFGLVEDDDTPRAIANLAACINPAIQPNTQGMSAPTLWVYYPEYALSTPQPAYANLKTLVDVLEAPFFEAFETRVAETLAVLPATLTETLTPATCAAITSTRLFTELPEVFSTTWRSFAFTSTLPADNRLVILAGRPLEALAFADRAPLAQKRTLSFGPVGVYNERLQSTSPWFADVVSFTLPAPLQLGVTWPVTMPAVHLLSVPPVAYAGHVVDVAVAWRNLPLDADQQYDLIVQLENWDVEPGVYYQRRLSAFDSAGTLTMTLDIPNAVATHTQPLAGSRYVAAFVSKVCDWCDVLTMDASPQTITIQPYRWVTVTTPWGLSCPAWTAWTASPSTGDFRTLATFSGGDLDGLPAIVQSLDGQHTAFLYDALAWKTITSDAERAQIEASLACHHALLFPSAPQLFAPGDGTLTNTAALTLTWENTYAAGYNVLLNGSIFTTSTPYSPTLLADDEYMWTVRAFSLLGEYTLWAPLYHFRVDTTPPAVPTLTMPLDGALLDTRPVTLTWEPVPDLGLAGYQVRVTETTYTVPANVTTYTLAAIPDGVYTWTVRAYDQATNPSPWAIPWTFTLRTTSTSIYLPVVMRDF